MRIYWINAFPKGNVAMMARPRGMDWLEDEIIKLKMQDVDVVVSLLERNEVLELGLRDEDKHCEQHGIHLINYPIPDRGIPADAHSFIQLVQQLSALLAQGQNIAVHCRLGIGRTGILCAALLRQAGFPKK